jgi:hypothetical protein
VTEAEIFSETIRTEMIRLLATTEPIPLDKLEEAQKNARKYFERMARELRGPVHDGPTGAAE